MAKGIFITATGTDVGKTFVTGLIVKKMRQAGYSCGYYKAALSGAEWADGKLLPGDACYVNEIAGLKRKPQELVSYIYEKAVSPHLAAKLEENPVELDKVKADFTAAAQMYDYVTVEGSGGIVCPIRYDKQKLLLEDIIKNLDLAVIVIADAGLGTINSVVLTIEYLQKRNIAIKGIILNNYNDDDIMHRDNKYMVEELTGQSVVAVVKNGETELNIEPSVLAGFYA